MRQVTQKRYGNMLNQIIFFLIKFLNKQFSRKEKIIIRKQNTLFKNQARVRMSENENLKFWTIYERSYSRNETKIYKHNTTHPIVPSVFVTERPKTFKNIIKSKRTEDKKVIQMRMILRENFSRLFLVFLHLKILWYNYSKYIR